MNENVFALQSIIAGCVGSTRRKVTVSSLLQAKDNDFKFASAFVRTKTAFENAF